MSAYDKYHNVVKKALINDGWTITDDPYKIKADSRIIRIDLGAERLIGAQKANEKIAVEIKSFLKKSQITAFYEALGQTTYYKTLLKDNDPKRLLFLAIPLRAYKGIFSEPYVKKIMTESNIYLIVYDIYKEKIISWIK